MAYRTKTYIAADFDSADDVSAVKQLRKWNDNSSLSLSFTDAHDLQTSRDSSLYCSIRASLKERMDHSKRFVLIVGKNTDSITKGGCQYCSSYNSYLKTCARGHSVDYRSYIKYECEIALDAALDAGIDIIVLYNDTRVDKSKCPSVLRNVGKHKAMVYYKEGKYYWDYQTVKSAF